jgi:hypothetical protein
MGKKIDLPELPLEKWEKSKITLHLILQILGKIRLSLAPRKNHWWYITEYIVPKGFSTSSMPYHEGMETVEILLNIHIHQLEIFTSRNEHKSIKIYDGLSIAGFYNQLTKSLQELGIPYEIVDKPFDLGISARFSKIEEFHHYDPEYIHRFWRILLWIDGIFKEFSGRFYGKTCPVHLYWHHMDLAVTRFSGKKAPPSDPSARISDKDAYSHEVISFGFWAGDEQVREPAFYAYVYPSPEGLSEKVLKPEGAYWVDNNGSPMAFYSYHQLIREQDPRQKLLDFLESSYQAGASLAGWDIEALKTVDLERL